MINIKQMRAVACVVMLMLTATGCDKIANSSRAAQDVTRHAFEDTKSSWRDFFMYHPPVPDALPQTRYCYQMLTDVVCYDSEQPSLTSKLVGYQDGENIAWVQPGGGSLGASGGPPVALRPLTKREESRASTSSSYRADTQRASDEIYTGPVGTSGGGSVVSNSGQISVNVLPPAGKKTN